MHPIIRPKALQPGDTIAIAALSGELETESVDQYERGIAELKSLGFQVRPSKLVDVTRHWWWAAARPAEVAQELNDLFRDPEVRAIWALTGGRFTLSYLDALDYDAIAANPKPLIGMSDTDAVLLAIHSMTGLVTIHGDNLIDGLGDWNTLAEPERATHADLYRRVLSSPEPAGCLPALSTWEVWRQGQAEGHLLGGLLPRLLRLQATPYAFAPDRFDGAILFLEDLAVPTINVWNDLQVLRQGGVFDRIAGLLIGPTETVIVAEYAPQTLRDVVLDVLGDRDIPVMGNVNFGHVDPNIPLPLGIRAAIDADALTIDLIEPAVG
jgi:muramoyltetrapeptide carboxypeptidase LdcA involved in peptidoglycan recycling